MAAPPTDTTYPRSSLRDALQLLWEGIVRFVFPPPAAQTAAARASAKTEYADNSDGQPQTGANGDGHESPPREENPFEKPLSLRLLLDWLQNAANLSRSPFYKMGYKSGLEGSHHAHGVEAIEGGFDALILSENQLLQIFGKEITEARLRIAHLEQEVATLDAHLDEQDPDSRAGRLRREIQMLHEEVNAHLQAQYNDRFVRDHDQIMEERKKTELEFIAQMKERLRRKSEELDKTDDEDEREAKQRKLEREQENVSKRYTKLATANKSDAAAVPGAMRILLNLIFFLLVLGGEFFIIYHLTRKVLGMDEIAVAEQYKAVSRLLTNAIYVFCVAYPLALGMLVKNIISKSGDRAKTTRRILRLICAASLLMIAGIAVLNPSFLELPRQIQKLVGLENAGSALHAVYALIFFGITLLFSGVAGILYVEFIEGYEQYWNARKKSPFEILPLEEQDKYIGTREAEIQKREKEIAGLRQQREQARQKMSESQGLASMDLSNWHLADTLRELKKAAASAFRFGYQRGLSELLRKKDYDPATFLDMVYSRKIIKHYMKIFDENP